MRILLLLAVPTLFSVSAMGSGTEKCFNNPRLKEDRIEMMSSFRRQENTHAEREFKTLCEKYRDTVECKVEKTTEAKSSARAKELTKGDPCAEVHFAHSKDDVTLYFLTDKSKPLK